MELTATKVKKVHFTDNIGQKNEKKQNLCEMKEETYWKQKKSNLCTKKQEQARQKRVKFDDRVQYFCYEMMSEDYSEVRYNRLIKDLWRKHNEVGIQIEHFSLLQDNQEPPKKQMLKLTSILERLQHMEKRTINFLSETPNNTPEAEPLVYTYKIKLQEESNDPQAEELQSNEHNKDEQNTNGKQQPVTITGMTIAQKTVFAATEKSSTPYIMTELEIVRKEIDDIISEAIQNQHFLATQLTNDNAKTKELLKLTRSKRMNEEKKWYEAAQRVGYQRADEMKSCIKEIDEEAQTWWKERQQKLNLAESLMVTVSKEQSASCRIQMVAQRPELSREIVLVEAAKILSFIKVMQPQNLNNTHLDQWLEEQYYSLTTKMTIVQADLVMQEVYNKLPIKITEDK